MDITGRPGRPWLALGSPKPRIDSSHRTASLRGTEQFFFNPLDTHFRVSRPFPCAVPLTGISPPLQCEINEGTEKKGGGQAFNVTLESRAASEAGGRVWTLNSN